MLFLSGCGVADQGSGRAAATYQAPVVVKPAQPQPSQETPAAAGTPPALQSPVPAAEENVLWANMDIHFIEQRLTAYEKKSQQWMEDEGKKPFSAPGQDKSRSECAKRLQHILSAYTKQRDNILAGKPAAADTRAPLLLRQDIAFLESDCMKDLLTPGPATDPLQTLLIQSQAEDAETRINTAIERGNYDEGLTLYQSLKTSFPDHGISQKTSENYALALLYKGQPQEAAAVYRKMITTQAAADQTLKPWKMRRRLADLLLAGGDLTGAKNLYTELVESHNQLDRERSWAESQLTSIDLLSTDVVAYTTYRDLLRNFLTFDGKHKGADAVDLADRLIMLYPDTAVGRNSDAIKTSIYNRLKSWVTGQLMQADKLIEEKMYDEATIILKEMMYARLPLDLAEVVQDTLDNSMQLEAKELEAQKALLGQSLVLQWEEAVRSLDSRRYDEAIKGFEALLGTDYDERARQKISEAAAITASEKRKEAAILFSKAGKTDDPAKKREMLRESRLLLLEIITKYPKVDITSKANQNLSVLEQYIQDFDPSIMEEGPEGEPAEDSPVDKEQGAGGEEPSPGSELPVSSEPPPVAPLSAQ